MSTILSISDYVLEEGKRFALYTLQFRAIPYLADGLKAGARRTLWCARDGAKHKSATLAGLAVPLHPHAPPEDSIDTLTGPYVNNIPLFQGSGTFGTLLNPTAYGASRYTSVKVSNFTKDVIFKDIEVIPMVPNYDNSLMEPKHFLPLSPIAIMNPTDGIAVGFATHILPRAFKDIVESQLEHLAGKPVKERAPHFLPTNNPAIKTIDKKGLVRWMFKGDYKKSGANDVIITRLPYGITHSDFTSNLHTLIDKELIHDFDDASRDKINITVKFKRGTLAEYSTEELEKLLKLNQYVLENLNVVNLDGNAVVPRDYVTIIKEFTDWRLDWYIDRYIRLLELLNIDIQHYDDILLAIKKNVAGVSKKATSRANLKEFIADIGVVYVDYIADLPVYRFTEEEARKIQQKREDALVLKKSYEDILADDSKRKAIYISELKEVLKKYG